MKELFEQYEQIRRLAETAVERVAHLIRIHHAPDQELCEQVSVLLTGLLSRYKAIPQAMNGQLHRVAMPVKGSTVPEYQAAWEESITRSHEYARDVLGDVGRIRSDDPHYADALRPLQEQAQALLDAIPAAPEAPFRTDLHAWEVLIEACASAAPLPTKLLESLSNCGEALPRPVVFGLLLNKYRLGAADAPEASVTEDTALPTAPDLPEDDFTTADDLILPDMPDLMAEDDTPAGVEDEPVAEIGEPAAEADEPFLPDLPDEEDEPVAVADDSDFPDLPVEEDEPADEAAEPDFPDLPDEEVEPVAEADEPDFPSLPDTEVDPVAVADDPDFPSLPDEEVEPVAEADDPDFPALPDEEVEPVAVADDPDIPDLPGEDESPAAEADEPAITPECPALPEDPADAFVPADDPMVHPVEPLKPARIPSEQKLTELIRATHPISGSLLKTLGFFGLMDLQQIYAHLHAYEPEVIDRTISLLINRGYMALYLWQGRQVLCFTPQMNECVEKPNLALTLRNLLRQKKLTPITFLADDNIPRSAFEQRLARVDFQHSFLDALWKDAEALILLPSSACNDNMDYFLKLERPGHPLVLLLLTPPEELRDTPAAQQQGAISYADELPDMTGVEDDLHFCLTPAGLQQWRGGAWFPVRL